MVGWWISPWLWRHNTVRVPAALARGIDALGGTTAGGQSSATLREVVQRCGCSLGHEALTSASAAAARRAIARAKIDVLCLDSVLPLDDIEDLCQAFAATANGRTSHIVYIGPPAAKLTSATLPLWLREKIDAFIAKPVDPANITRELVRVLSDGSTRARPDDLLSVDGVALDSVTRKLHRADGVSIALTRVEHRLLRCLMEQPGEYISTPDLLERVWGYPPDGGSELVRAHVSDLRRKLRILGQDALLCTMPYHGYAFVPDAAPAPSEG